MLNSPVEEIKQRLDIIDVLSEYLQFKKTGTNFKANCPFHNEKTPSFVASKEKQIWHCFGCSKGGDIFTFIQEIEGIEFPEALRILAEKANVELKKQDPVLTNKKTTALDILKAASVFFQDKLNSEEGKIAKQYLQQRALKEEIIEEFKLGYSLDEWEALNNFLLKNGFTENDIFQAGLTVKKNKGIGYYDRFRGRIMFPIKDVHSNIVGFTARLLKEDPEKKVGKYINTPQTLVYDKSQVIYGLDKAKQYIKKLGATIVVEGNMDVIAAHQAGFKNVVASSGTAFTEKQLTLLKRYSSNLIIAFDMDDAGMTATKRSIDLALQLEMNIKILTLPVGFKDPDDCLRNDPVKFKESIKNAQNIMEYYFANFLKNLDLSKIDDKKKLAVGLLPIISKIIDSIEQTHYLQKLGELINVSEDALREKLIKFNNSKKFKNFKSSADSQTDIKPQPEIKARDRFDKISERLIALAINNTEDFKYFVDNLDPDFITDKSMQTLYKNLIIFYNQKEQLNIDSFVQKEKEYKRQIEILTLLIEKDFSSCTEKEIQNEVINSIRILEKKYIQDRINILEKEIKKAESDNAKDKVEELMGELNLLLQKLTQTSK